MTDSQPVVFLRRWGTFLRIVFDPWILILTVFTAAFVYFSSAAESRLLGAVLSSVASMGAAVLGGVITKEWLDYAETRVLVARGRTAVRNLKLLLNNLFVLENRTYEYIARLESDCSPIVRLNLEEIAEKCKLLQDETINSIENWTDIIPEADVSTQIGRIAELQTKVADKELDLTLLREEVADVRAHSDKEHGDLRSTIARKENELRQTRLELHRIQTSLGGSIAASSSVPPFVGITHEFVRTRCTSCGKQFAAKVDPDRPRLICIYCGTAQ